MMVHFYIIVIVISTMVTLIWYEHRGHSSSNFLPSVTPLAQFIQLLSMIHSSLSFSRTDAAKWNHFANSYFWHCETHSLSIAYLLAHSVSDAKFLLVVNTSDAATSFTVISSATLAKLLSHLDPLKISSLKSAMCKFHNCLCQPLQILCDISTDSLHPFILRTHRWSVFEDLPNRILDPQPQWAHYG